MLKRTLHFGNPAYLNLQNGQLIISYPGMSKITGIDRDLQEQLKRSIPIEDIAVIVLDHKQITITQSLLGSLIDNNVAVITCDNSHHPIGLMLPLEGHSTQSQKFHYQLEASLPLKKQLWQQTVSYKIMNQASMLDKQGVRAGNMMRWAKEVRSGDPENVEAKAAVYYWKHLFGDLLDFRRGREDAPPNNLLNYGYSILRATTARCLVGSGLLPTYGIHHSNKYNAYCLADDIMEPYRPYIDLAVCQIIKQPYIDYTNLTSNLKAEIIKTINTDVWIEGQRSPLMVAMQRTTASLARCFEGSVRRISYPLLEPNSK